MNFPIDIYQIILLFTDFITQIRIRQLNKLFYNKLDIYDFYNINHKYLVLLDNKILRNYPFIKYLNANDNEHITDVNYLTKLEELDAHGDCRINNEGIADLNLIKINVSCNPFITNLNHMTKLKILIAWDGSEKYWMLVDVLLFSHVVVLVIRVLSI